LRGYLYRFPLPIPTAGPRVYTLGAPGRDLLESLGEPVDWHFRPHRVKHFSYAHVLHALLVTRLVCAAHAFVRTHQEFRLVESHLCYELAKTPAMVALPNTVEAPPLPVVPDALLVFAACEARGEEDLLPVLVEADRGREHRVSFTTHLRLRLELLRQQAYRHWLGGVEALRIAYVTTGERPEYRATRCQAMVKWASELLAELKKQEYGQCFYFTSVVWEELYAPPCRLFEAPVWYQPGAPETPVSLLAN
jgi:hypothetical protein